MCDCDNTAQLDKVQADLAYIVGVVKKLEEGVALAASNPMLKTLGIKF